MNKLIASLLMIISCNHTYDSTIKGKTDKLYNTKNDSVYVGLIWHSNDGPGFNATYSDEIAVIRKGKFRLKVTKTPPASSRMILKNSELSVAYIVIFKDDGDGKFTKDDKILGVCEKNCFTYVSGNLNKDLDTIERRKRRKIPTLRRLKNGLNFAKVKTPKEHGLYSAFDDLISTKKSKIIIKTKTKNNKLKAPNWT